VRSVDLKKKRGDNGGSVGQMHQKQKHKPFVCIRIYRMVWFT